MRAPILAVILASVPALAAADEVAQAPAPAPTATAPAYAPVATIEQQPVVVNARAEDPNIDRVFLLPSAETQPAGTLSFNDYELLLLGVTYGVTDNFQITGQALAPIVKDMPTFLNGSAKLVVLRTDRLRLAVQGGLTYVNANDDGPDNDSALGASLGGIVSICLDADCHSMATGSVTGFSAIAGDNTDNDIGILYSGGVTAKVAKHAKLLLEVTSAAAQTSESGFTSADSALVSYGVRFFSSSIAGDIGFVKPVGDAGDDDFILCLPFINFTYRQ